MISAKDLQHNITEQKVESEPSTTGALSREPSPNRGGSIPDFKAIGPESEKKVEWLQKRRIDTTKQVKLRRLVHMRYQHPDLSQINVFLKDFGLHVAKKTDTQRWYRGYGQDQYVYYAQQGPKKYLGGTFEAQSFSELEKVALLPGVKVTTNGIEEMTDAPGGGHIISIEDPEGFPVNFIFGQRKRETNAKPKESIIWNDEINKPRKKAFQRFQPGPAEVYKLGHFGLNVGNFANQMDWYTRHFNLIPSDILYVGHPQNKGERIEVALFAHINLGKELTDHHTFFMTSLAPDPSGTYGASPHVHHSSFEVHDLDTQFLGHQWLAEKNYSSVWGVGRHILGSQIFDYWWDTTGFMVEHYADGDLVNMDTDVGYGPAGHEGLAVWGPEVPKAFLE